MQTQACQPAGSPEHPAVPAQMNLCCWPDAGLAASTAVCPMRSCCRDPRFLLKARACPSAFTSEHLAALPQTGLPGTGCSGLCVSIRKSLAYTTCEQLHLSEGPGAAAVGPRVFELAFVRHGFSSAGTSFSRSCCRGGAVASVKLRQGCLQSPPTQHHTNSFAADW